MILLASHAVHTSSPFPRISPHMTLPAARVSSIRPKANYLSGTLHFCSPCRFFLFLIVFSFPPSLHVTNQSVYLSTGCTSWECGLKQIQYPPLADSCLSYSVRKKNAPSVHLLTMWGKNEKTVHHRRTQMVIWTFVLPFFFYHNPFFRTLICAKTSVRPSSGLKATIRCDFPLQIIFLRGRNGLKMDPLAACSSSKRARQHNT